MSWANLLVVGLLIIGVATGLISLVGVLVMDDPFERLHYLSPLSTASPVLFAAAILIKESFSQAGIKAIAIAITLALANTILTHATARAQRIREFGRWEIRPEEKEDFKK